MSSLEKLALNIEYLKALNITTLGEFFENSSLLKYSLHFRA